MNCTAYLHTLRSISKCHEVELPFALAPFNSNYVGRDQFIPPFSELSKACIAFATRSLHGKNDWLKSVVLGRQILVVAAIRMLKQSLPERINK